MACYFFNLNGKDFKITTPTNLQDFAPDSWQAFLVSLAELKKSDPEQYNQFYQALLDHATWSSNSLDRRNNKEIANCIAANLEQYGIKMVTHDAEEWEELRKANNIDPNGTAQALVLDDTIHVKKDSFKVSDAMHELSHLILAYMRVKNMGAYRNFITRMTAIPAVAKILQEEVKELNNYSGLDIELGEEAVVRYLSGLFTEGPVDASIYSDDIIEFVNTALQSYIIEMFGLSGSDYPGVMDFMSSLLADLPAKFGASIFKSYGIEETGFSKDRAQVKRRMQMKTFIDYLVSNDRLEKTECV